MTNTNRILKIWIFVSIVVLLFPILIFVSKFYTPDLSNNLIDWTNFSIYFSNILNPLLLCINILLLIKLTYEVANYNEKNMRNDMRQRAYVEISNKLYSFAIIIQTSENKQRDLALLRNDIISFSSTMNHLFNLPNFETITDEIDNTLIKISESDFVEGNLLAGKESEEYKIFISFCENYDKSRTNLINQLQNLILS